MASKSSMIKLERLRGHWAMYQAYDEYKRERLESFAECESTHFPEDFKHVHDFIKKKWWKRICEQIADGILGYQYTFADSAFDAEGCLDMNHPGYKPLVDTLYTIAADCFITPKGNLMDGIEMYSVNFRERKADCNPALSVTLRGHEVATYIDDYRWLRELNLPDGVTFSDINVCFPARSDYSVVMEGVDWDLALGVNSLGDEPWTVEDDDKEFEEAEIEKDKLSEEAKMEDCKGVEGSTKKSWFSWGS